MRHFFIFSYELNHFLKTKTKVVSYLFFVLACIYSLFNGFQLQDKQLNTIENIKEQETESLAKVLNWFENDLSGPEDRSWVDVTDPYWAIRYSPTYVIKEPSLLLPLGIGQAEQYGYYQKLSIWSSPLDNDIVEEISNYERLINGNIDFSFLILFLLPLLIIILTYNVRGLESDLKFHDLVSVQVGDYKKWVFYRLLFYAVLLLFSVDCLFLSVAIINNVFSYQFFELIILSNFYILIYFISFYLIIIKSNGSISVAFKMIALWLTFCVLVPGAVHQYINLKYPTNYMTDFLDANRKDTYDVFKLSKEELNKQLIEIYPELLLSKHAKDSVINRTIVRNTMSAIVNQINVNAIEKINQQNFSKNNLITKAYFFNPLSFFQNKWNALTETDYHSYSDYRKYTQSKIDKRLELLVYDCWNSKKLDLKSYNEYLNLLK